MLRKDQRQRGIVTRVVGKHGGFRRDVLAQKRNESLALQTMDNHAASAPGVAVDQRQHFPLLRRTILGLRLARVDADKGFVNFDRTAAATKRSVVSRFHRQPDTVRHKPCALERDAKSAMQLIRANALLARRDQEDCLQPEAQLNVARLEYGPYLDRKWLATVVALVRPDPGSRSVHGPVALDSAAMRADRATGPNTGFDEAVSGFFVMEMRGGKNGLAHGVSPYL